MPRLVVFDFDWTLVDQDTDRWIFEVCSIAIRREMEDLDLEGSVQWTDIVAQSLERGHAQGITRENIQDALRSIPFHPAMIRAVEKLKSGGDTTFFCLSNANSVFISTILESKNLGSLFDEIITNPAHWESSGLLRLKRRVDPNGPQHNCTIGCNANMCKGEELEAFLKRNPGPFDQVIYVGDGSNDFCPVLRLSSQDMVLCRRLRGLERRIKQDGQKLGLKCKVKFWEEAWEVEEVFRQL